MTELPVSREDWAKTEIHKASTYSCRWCAREFAMPHDFYDHLPECPSAPANCPDGAPVPEDDYDDSGRIVTYLGRSVLLSELEIQAMRGKE